MNPPKEGGEAGTDRAEELSALQESGLAYPATPSAEPVRKGFTRGTHRAIPPGDTLARLRPWLAAMKITRVANLTGLDVVGIPVAQAVRPNALSNAVSQGKGLDLESAKASAVMEAIETSLAEQIRLPARFACADELAREGRVIDTQRLPQRPDRRYQSSLDMLWIEGQDLMNGERVWVPYETIHTRYRTPYPPGSGCFPMTTTGLASGNCLMEATIHGLTEVIERDAAAQFESYSRRWDSSRVDLSSVDDPDCKDLIRRFERVGIIVAVWEVTSDVGVPTFMCHVTELPDGPGLVPRPAEGFGCHLDKAVALLRALTEAAQARVTVISGARDDIPNRRYGRNYDGSNIAGWLRSQRRISAGKDFSEIDSVLNPTFEADLAFILERLRVSGINEAVMVDLSPQPGLPCRVVRIVVPGLEALEGGTIPEGRRAPDHRKGHSRWRL